MNWSLEDEVAHALRLITSPAFIAILHDARDNKNCSHSPGTLFCLISEFEERQIDTLRPPSGKQDGG